MWRYSAYFCRFKSGIWLPEFRLFVVLSCVSFLLSVCAFMCEYMHVCIFVPTYMCICKLYLFISSDFVIGHRL